MTFVLHPPDPRLAAQILGYWRLDGLRPGRRYSAAPKRHLDFVVNIGAPQVGSGSNNAPDRLFIRCWITGLRGAPLYIVPTGETLSYGVRFRDFAVPQWLAGNVSRDPAWSTDVGLCSATEALAAALASGPDLVDAAAIFDRLFLSRLSPSPAADRLRHAVEACERAGRLAPAAILRHLEDGTPRLRGPAKAAVGVTLRRFSRVARFDRALVSLGSEPDLRIADVAHDVGYYDEAHMAHDFVRLAGISPAGFRHARQTLEGASLPHHLIAG